MIEIYTDGSCLSNPGPGGWATCLIEDGSEYYFSGGDKLSTNNRMELTAIIEALSSIKKGVECVLYTDSQLSINCATGKWKRKANTDLWEEYDKVSKGKDITFKWVKAHNGNKYNEIVDSIAYKEARKRRKK